MHVYWYILKVLKKQDYCGHLYHSEGQATFVLNKKRAQVINKCF